MKTSFKDYILLVLMGVLFGYSILMTFNVVHHMEMNTSILRLVICLFIFICLAFVKTGRDIRRANPARYDREFYNKVENYKSRY